MLFGCTVDEYSVRESIFLLGKFYSDFEMKCEMCSGKQCGHLRIVDAGVQRKQIY